MASSLRAAAWTPPAYNRALLWLAAALSGGAIHLLIWQLSEPPQIFSDFYKAYWKAAGHLWTGGLSATYPFTVRGHWSNLPIIGWLFAPLTPLGENEAAWTYLGIGLVLSLLAWMALTRLAKLATPSAALLLFLFTVNGPLVYSLREGNSTHLLLLPMAASLLLWRAKREYAAGLVLGICATFKPPLLLFGFYFLLRRRWWIVAGGATTVSVAALASLAVFGIDGHIRWHADVIEPHIGTMIAAFNSQTIDGFLIRLSTGALLLVEWYPVVPATWQKIARFAIIAAIYCGAFWVLWRSRRSDPASAATDDMSGRDLIEFSVVLIIALVTSPVTWTHYYMLLLLPIALYLGGTLPLPDDRTTHWLMCSSIVLTSLPVVIPDLGLGLFAEIAARTLISAWLCGAMLMFWALLRGAWACRAGSREPVCSVQPRTTTQPAPQMTAACSL